MAEIPQTPGATEAAIRRGGRRRSGRLVETTVVLDREDMAALDKVAAEEGRSRSELIREAIRKTWLKGRSPGQPASPHGGVGTSPEERAAWRQRFSGLMTELEKSAVTDMSEEELTAFVREEIEARRRENREAPEPHEGSRWY
jgi:rRNA pseudouridine-1189 N-methylase Emg1 (Nep1/Mra1 family)